MSRTNETSKWLKKTVRMLCNELDLSARVVVASHYKVYFSNRCGVSCMCVIAKSTGDKNSRHIEIGLIRRELRNKLGVDADRDLFTMSYQQTSFL